MNWVGATVVFVLIWWAVFFMVLPFGVRTAEESGAKTGEGHAESAPMRPMLLRKALITTLIACLLFAVYVVIAIYDLFGFEAYLRAPPPYQ